VAAWLQTPVQDRPATAIFTLSDDVHENRTHLWGMLGSKLKSSQTNDNIYWCNSLGI